MQTTRCRFHKFWYIFHMPPCNLQAFTQFFPAAAPHPIPYQVACGLQGTSSAMGVPWNCRNISIWHFHGGAGVGLENGSPCVEREGARGILTSAGWDHRVERGWGQYAYQHCWGEGWDGGRDRFSRFRGIGRSVIVLPLPPDGRQKR